MSPVKFFNEDHDHHSRNHVINGSRPSPLKINRESHSIQKPNHSSTIIPVLAASTATGNKEQKRQPVIIYTHSPKIIHTQARDFMALVQKLTGLSRPDNNDNDNEEQAYHDEQGSKRQGTVENYNNSSSNDVKLENNNGSKSVISHEDNESSSVVTEENTGVNGYDHNNNNVVKPGLSSFADIPLFTPSAAADFFCSPRPVYRLLDTTSSSSSSLSPTSFSPSFLEFMKGLPEY